MVVVCAKHYKNSGFVVIRLCGCDADIAGIEAIDIIA